MGRAAAGGSNTEVLNFQFGELGFEAIAALEPDQILAGDEFFGSVSAERLDLIDTVVLVWSQLQFTEGGRDAIEADPLVQQLEVTVAPCSSAARPTTPFG